MDVHPVTDSKKGINIDRSTWKSISRKYYTLNNGMITDQMISDSWGYMTNKVWDEKAEAMVTGRSRKQIVSVLWTLLESESSYTQDRIQGMSDIWNMSGMITSSARNKSKP